MRSMSLWLAFCLAGCARGLTEVSLNQEFELSTGQSARVAGSDVVVTFEAVPADSRCPLDAQCVWAGNALVRLRVHTPDLDSLVELNTTLEPRSGAVGGVTLELRDLEPTPRLGEPPENRRYRARLLIREH